MKNRILYVTFFGIVCLVLWVVLTGDTELEGEADETALTEGGGSSSADESVSSSPKVSQRVEGDAMTVGEYYKYASKLGGYPNPMEAKDVKKYFDQIGWTVDDSVLEAYSHYSDRTLQELSKDGDLAALATEAKRCRSYEQCKYILQDMLLFGYTSIPSDHALAYLSDSLDDNSSSTEVKETKTIESLAVLYFAKLRGDKFSYFDLVKDKVDSKLVDKAKTHGRKVFDVVQQERQRRGMDLLDPSISDGVSDEYVDYILPDLIAGQPLLE